MDPVARLYSGIRLRNFAHYEVTENKVTKYNPDTGAPYETVKRERRLHVPALGKSFKDPYEFEEHLCDLAAELRKKGREVKFDITHLDSESKSLDSYALTSPVARATAYGGESYVECSQSEVLSANLRVQDAFRQLILSGQGEAPTPVLILVLDCD